MANWLEKILPSNTGKPPGRNLPANKWQGPLPASFRTASGNNLPNASVIYGIAASALFVIGLYFLFFTQRWVTGLLIMLPGGCFLGFALHFLKHSR